MSIRFFLTVGKVFFTNSAQWIQVSENHSSTTIGALGLPYARGVKAVSCNSSACAEGIRRVVNEVPRPTLTPVRNKRREKDRKRMGESNISKKWKTHKIQLFTLTKAHDKRNIKAI